MDHVAPPTAMAVEATPRILGDHRPVESVVHPMQEEPRLRSMATVRIEHSTGFPPIPLPRRRWLNPPAFASMAPPPM